MEVHGSPDGAHSRASERSPSLLVPALKRLIDIAVSGLVLALTLPLLLIAAAAIRLESPGPVIVRCARIGANGHRFDMYRLRSTIHGADDVTRVGRVLRWASIDELPQQWNVLRGDMSLVGPRPQAPAESAHEAGSLQSKRLRVVPGLTGTWAEGDARPGDDRHRRADRGGPPARGGSGHQAG